MTRSFKAQARATHTTRLLRHIAAVGITLCVLAGIATLSGVRPTDSAYTATSNAMTAATVSITPAYRMTCTTSAIDYGVTENGKVYYGTGNAYVTVSDLQPLDTKKIVQVACNETLMAGIDSLGDVYIWETIPVSATKLAVTLNPGESFVKITSTYESISALTSTGRVFSFGDNASGQLGTGAPVASSPTSRVPYELQYPTALLGSSLKDIAGVMDGVVGLTTSGKIIQWGQQPDGTLSQSPVQINQTGALLYKTIVSVGGSIYAGLALDSDGILYSWGRSVSLGLNETSNKVTYQPTAVNSFGSLANRKVSKLFTQYTAPVFVVAADGTAHSWGPSGAQGTLETTGYVSSTAVPAALNMNGALSGKTITNIFPGSYTTSAQIAEDKGLYWWGYGWFISRPNENAPTSSFGGRELIPQ